jgi:predicted TIM-barrel fold metal-dependent hydrolase
MKPSPDMAPPIINCHTHIFKGENVPPYIAKTFIPWPFYKLLTVPFILWICRGWYLNDNSPRQWKHKWWYKKIQRIVYTYRSFIKRYLVTDLLIGALNIVIVWHALIFFGAWLTGFFIKPDANTNNLIIKSINWLKEHQLLFMPASGFIKWLTVLFTLFFIARGRKLIFFILKKAWHFLSIMPNKQTLQFLARYLNIGRFAYYKNQARIFFKLKDQYAPGTRFILLPMDMEFMDAGKLKPGGDYESQMKELAAIKRNKNHKDSVYPFVFADPRRQSAGNQVFFDWAIKAPGEVILKDCFIKQYIEKEKFSGFKIYPALGYYPFDEKLLPLWKYAADNQLPILTHTIRGTIFFRGRKKKEWGYHEVFKQANGLEKQGPLLLPQLKNIDYCNNFTHPLNYLCLVEEKLLRILVAKASDAVKQLFGYTNDNTPLLHNLKHLKLCFGHFGGEDEWERFFESDRDNITSQLVKKPEKGIVFMKDGPVENSFFTLEQVWKNTDWYTIICSMMLQYDNLYADISYILHDEKIFPLLKQTLQNDKLKTRVLFGTDFYVVRNHKSEKQMLADLQKALTPNELAWITYINPKTFLNLP